MGYEITAIGKTFEKASDFAQSFDISGKTLNQMYPALDSLNSTAKREMLSQAPVEPVPLFAELFNSLRFAVAPASRGDSFTPGGGGNSGGLSRA